MSDWYNQRTMNAKVTVISVLSLAISFAAGWFARPELDSRVVVVSNERTIGFTGYPAEPVSQVIYEGIDGNMHRGWGYVMDLRLTGADAGRNPKTVN
jgi:hypothetical protein